MSLSCSQLQPDTVVPTSRPDPESANQLLLALASMREGKRVGGLPPWSLQPPTLPASKLEPALEPETARASARMPSLLYEPSLTRAEHHRAIRKVSRAGMRLISCASCLFACLLQSVLIVLRMFCELFSSQH